MRIMPNKIIRNIFSNWANLVVTVVISFVVSPIMVNGLGKEHYGIWVLIFSLTGYFTVLDFGVNTAIVRYISSSVAKSNFSAAGSVFSSAFAIFSVVAAAILLFSSLFGLVIPDIFDMHQLSRGLVYAIFMISATDLALGLVFSVYLGALTGLQQFEFINGVSIATNLIRSALLILGLRNGYGLIFLALLQLGAGLCRAGCHYCLVKRYHRYLRVDSASIDRSTVSNIFSYSLHSFVIAVALKLLFYTDSVVIGARIGVAEVAYYSVPATLLDYVEKFVWSMTAVLVPIISTNEAQGDGAGNARYYLLGTRYSLLVSTPVVISLYLYGADFIGLWMGHDFKVRSAGVLKLLLIGFGFAFTQLTAHAVLKGISRHNGLAFILAVEAGANVAMSVLLAKRYGIEGVALGTTVPLVAATLVVILYTCRVLGVGVWGYLFRTYSLSVLGTVFSVAVVNLVGLGTESYLDVALNSAIVAAAFLSFTLPFSVEKEHRSLILRMMPKFSNS